MTGLHGKRLATGRRAERQALGNSVFTTKGTKDTKKKVLVYRSRPCVICVSFVVKRPR